MSNRTKVKPVLPLTSYLEHPSSSEIWMPQTGGDAMKTSKGSEESILHNVYDAVSNNSLCIRRFDNLTCTFCRTALKPKDCYGYAWRGHGTMIDYASCRNSAAAFRCTNCGWWYLRHHESQSGYNEHIAHRRLFEGAIYSFDSTKSIQAISSLRNRIRERKINLTDIAPTALEQLVGAVFRDYFQCKVTHIGGPGDEGIDLLLVYDSEVRTIVQVKRRQHEQGLESPSVVRELVGTMIHSGVNHGLLATSSAGVSEKTENWTRSFPERYSHLKIDIFNQQRILDALDLTTSVNPWKTLVGSLQKEVPSEIRRRPRSAS